MTTKHTPGPWHYEHNPGAAFSYIENGESIVAGIPNIPGCKETLANAQLLAATLDLLEALQDLRRWMVTPPLQRKDFEEMLIQTDITIAKAIGEKVAK